MNILSSLTNGSKSSEMNVPLLQQDGGTQSLHDSFPPTVVEKRKKRFKIPKWCRPFRCKKPKKMELEDRMNLNWVQKWLQYGRFPWKFIFHALLTAACTAMVFLQTNDQTPFVIGMDATWYSLFFPPDFQYAGDYADNSYYFYEINDTVDSVHYALQQHEKFPEVSVVPFEIYPIGESIAELTVRSYKDCAKVYDPAELNLDLQIISTVYHVSAADVGPFKNLTGEPLRKFFYCMESMTLSFGYNNTHLQYKHPLTYALTVHLLYDNSVQGGRIALTMSWDKDSLTSLPYTQLLQLYKAMLDLAIIFFALVSQILSWVSIGKSFQLLASARRRLSRRNLFTSINISSSNPNSPFQIGSEISWGRLPLRTKLRFFNMWFVITILGNLANICASLLDFFITEDAETGPFQRLLLGIGTLLAWINLVRYLEFDKKYTVLIAALQRGFPSALRFLLGTLPVFVGFALFGVAYFSEHSYRFSTFGTACVTLFGLQNGDDVQGTFKDTNRDLIVGRIYLAVFIFISIYGVANIFIAIMDESYSASTRQAENERLKKKQQLAPSRESDLNNDDDLWNAVLGFSKSANSPPNSGIPLSPTPPPPDDPSLSVNGGDDSADSGDDERSVEEFMEYLDAQHAKFRAKTQASLEKFLAAKEKASKNAQNSNKNTKISFDLGTKPPSSPPKSSSPRALRRRTIPPSTPSSSLPAPSPPPSPPSTPPSSSPPFFFSTSPTTPSSSANTTTTTTTNNNFFDTDPFANFPQQPPKDPK